MVASLVAAVSSSTWLGYELVALLLPSERRVAPASLALRLLLSVALGLGLSSVILFLATVAIGPLSASFLCAEILAVLLAAALLVRRAPWRRRREPWGARGSSGRRDPLSVSFGIVFAALVVLAVWGAVVFSMAMPHGPGDSWVLWAMRSRFVFRGDAQWEVFPSWAHPDYPLLLPLSVVRLWSFYGGETTLAQIAMGMGATAVAVGIVVAALWGLRGPAPALLGGIALLATPAFLIEGVSQAADVPLSVYYVAALVSLERAVSAGRDSRWGDWTLVGWFAGLAAWTKNEGLAFVAALVLVCAVRAASFGTRGLRECVAFSTGLIVPAAALLLFKLEIAPPSEFLDQPSGVLLDQLGSLERHAQVMSRLGREFWRLGSWDLEVVVAPWLIAYGLAMGLEPERARRCWPGAAVILLTLAAYCVAYVISPYDLEWHMGSSMSRVLLHLWPSVVFLGLAMTHAPTPRSVLRTATPPAGGSPPE